MYLHNFRLSILKFFEDTENKLSTAHYNRHDDIKRFYLRKNNSVLFLLPFGFLAFSHVLAVHFEFVKLA